MSKGDSNASDLPGAILQRKNIHLAVCAPGQVSETLQALRTSPKTATAKAKFILATDGETLEAEDLASGDTIASNYADFPRYLGFFLPLAGISTVREIKDNPIDVRATGRLNKLYIELLKDNPEWATEARRHDMNHFMARLIFCFFAEDTDIFFGESLFTSTVKQWSASDGSNAHEVVGTVFRSMNVKSADRGAAKIPGWADGFPYVNGGLFSGSTDVPRFSRIARTYLIHAGELSWREINPDIFGSMIQAVADDEERGALGMHYTSVPNILKVLNPLFLDDLRTQLAEAGDNSRALLNLRRRMAKIRIFDPACGSGNFLVIAYKEMRHIEAEINRRRGELDLRTEIPITNFRGIELRDFPAEIARLALIIAEYQCDVRYRGQKEALAEFLPLDAMNWITCGNALQIDWSGVCPPTASVVKLVSDDLFQTPLEQVEIDFENEGGETYLCGNPPYQGSVNQTAEQKADMARIFSPYLRTYKDLDYVASWLVKAAEYAAVGRTATGFVTTNSICQGEQVGMLWPILFSRGQRIAFAHTSFLWKNSAARNAGVTCIVVGLRSDVHGKAVLFSSETARRVAIIGPYLVPESDVVVTKKNFQISGLPSMVSGNKATDGGNLILSKEEVDHLTREFPLAMQFIRKIAGSKEFIRGESRWCLWLSDQDLERIGNIPPIVQRINRVREVRNSSRGKQANDAGSYPHRFVYTPHSRGTAILIPSVSSERRYYLPCGVVSEQTVISNLALAIYDADLWNMALIASRVHLVWIATVCGKLKTDFRYSNTLGWNTFPVPVLTDQNKVDLTRCAENILLAREAHFPATIADLYDPESMPDNLRQAHERNDEVLERIYIGRRFRNDTERLEKLFDLYTKMTAAQTASGTRRRPS